MQAANIGGAQIFVRLDDSQLGKDFSQIRDRLQKESSAWGNIVNGALMGVGFKGFDLVSQGLKGSVSTAADFEQAMLDASSVFGEFDRGSLVFKRLQEQAIKLGVDTKYSTTQGAEAMQQLAQAGMDVGTAIASSRGVLDLAAVSNSNVADTARFAATQLNVYGLAASDLAHVNDALTLANVKTNAEFSDLMFSMKYVAPLAKEMNVSFDETLAVLGKLADAGIRGEQAGTTLRMMFEKLVDPSKEGTQALKDMGISIDDLNNKKPGAFLDLLEKMGKGGMDMKAASDLFGTQAATGAVGLIKRMGIQSVRDLVGEMQAPENVGITQKMALHKQSGLKGQMEQATSSFGALSMKVGTPIVEELTRSATKAAAFFNDISAFIEKNRAEFETWGRQISSVGQDSFNFLRDVAVGTFNNIADGVARVAAMFTKSGTFKWDLGDFKTGLQIVLDGAESMSSNWGVTFELLKTKSALATLAMKSAFIGFVSGTYEGFKTLAENILSLMKQALDPENWMNLLSGDTSFAKIMEKAGLKDIGAAIAKEYEAARNKILLDTNQVGGGAGALLKHQAALEAKQREGLQQRQQERAAAAVPPPLKPDEIQQQLAGPLGALMGGGLNPAAMNQLAKMPGQLGAPEAKMDREERKEQTKVFKSSTVGLQDMHKQIQSGLIAEVPKQQLQVQKDILEKVGDIFEKLGLGNPAKDNPGMFGQ